LAAVGVSGSELHARLLQCVSSGHHCTLRRASDGANSRSVHVVRH